MYPQFGPNLCLQLVNGFLELVIYLLWGFSLSSSLCRSLFISFPWHAISLSFFIPWMQLLSFSMFLGWGKARICHLLGNDKGGQWAKCFTCDIARAKANVMGLLRKLLFPPLVLPLVFITFIISNSHSGTFQKCILHKACRMYSLQFLFHYS